MCIAAVNKLYWRVLCDFEATAVNYSGSPICPHVHLHFDVYIFPRRNGQDLLELDEQDYTQELRSLVLIVHDFSLQC